MYFSLYVLIMNNKSVKKSCKHFGMKIEIEIGYDMSDE